MRCITLLLAVFCLAAATIPQPVEAFHDSQATDDSNWTYTYLKATDGNRDGLREFVEKNWFVMDEVAVERGLFKNYHLIENISESNDPGGSEWDFIVAVEYFGLQSYTDIQEAFEEIRSEHKTVLVAGKGFRDLGRVVRSERVLIH